MRLALAIGIDKYDFAPLKGCVNDATAVANLLRSHGDGSPNFDVRLETNVPRKSNMRRMIRELFSGSHDTALLYYSGHGVFNERGGYLVPSDYRKDDEGIPMNEVLTLANDSATKNKIIILDCCHSGAITVPQLNSAISGHINEGITILTASKQEELAMEAGGKGIFTGLLLEALQGGAADLNGYITPASIYAYIDQVLGPWDQRPVFKNNVSRFTSLRQVRRPIDPAVLRNIARYFDAPDQEKQLYPSYEYSNDPAYKHMLLTPFAQEDLVSIFQELKAMQSVGLVEPVGENHLYWAAMNSKSCRLTPLGAHYWRLAKQRKI
ncbi:caspase family protein [Taibaiella koreensis]|uniref:caspase family protein n=1 Tax=Taibaiella koreensis TaxID=1268548 RepID=UPI000E5A027D|nr:caspase family protein [Taibaiella koreensis]